MPGRKIRSGVVCLLATLSWPESAPAQVTNGAIQGTVIDSAGLALAGTAISAINGANGLQRTTVSDATGLYRLAGLPVGAYEVRAEPRSSLPHTANNVVVNVGATTTVNFRVPLTLQSEAISITTAPPLIDSSDSGTSEVVTQVQVDGLPLNGRQYANLAALVPGVRLGFLFNYGKGTQFAPVVLGGSGRNVSYTVDGGEHNDDKRGGLTQLFPLDAIEEFNFHQRFKPEFGRASGAVLNVVTKTGRNELGGSTFCYLRDTSLNARTESERHLGLEKSAVRRYQFGGTIGGPVVRDRAHFLVSAERVSQTRELAVANGGLYPEGEGTFDRPLRETLLLGKFTSSLAEQHFVSARYALNRNRFFFTWPLTRDPGLRGTPNRPPESWSEVSNRYHSLNVGVTSVLKPSLLSELVVQYSSSANPFRDATDRPAEIFPSGYFRGEADLDIVVRQEKIQFRDDVTWRRGSHEFKAGTRIVREPLLQSTRFGEATRYYHVAEATDSPISLVTSFRYSFLPAETGTPNSQYAVYVQDRIRLGDQVTVDLGVRYELVRGFAIDQRPNPLFRELQQAGAAGSLAGMVGLEDFGKEPGEDWNNWAPRAGVVWDPRRDGRLIVRGGVGRYYDLAYADSTIGLAFAATGESIGEPAGIHKTDGTLLRPGDPIPATARRTVTSFALALSPRLRQPFTNQANVGVAKALGEHWALEIDALYSRGHDWPLLFDPNPVRDGRRRLTGVLPTMGDSAWSMVTSGGSDEYKAVTLGMKRSWDGRLQMLGSYTLASTRSTSPGAIDDYTTYQEVDALDPVAAVQRGPAGTDARHSANISAVWAPGAGFSLGAVFRVRSAVPYTVITGNDDDGNGTNFDLPPGSRTVNQARGSGFSQLDIRVLKRFGLRGMAMDLIVDAFNVFDRLNPSDYDGNMLSATFGQPLSYAGDGSGVGETRGGEQRQMRLGIRLVF